MNTALILKRFKDIGLTSYEAKSYLSLLNRDTLTVSEVSKLAGIPRPNAYEALERLMSKGLCASKPGHVKKYSASDPSLLEDKFLVEVNKAVETEVENLQERQKRITESSRAALEKELEKLKGREKQIIEENRSALKNELDDLREREQEVIEKSEASLKIELENLNKKEMEIADKRERAKENISGLVSELTPQYEKSRLETNPMDYIEIIKDPHQIHKKFMQLVAEAREEILVFTKPPFSRPREKRNEHLDQETEVLKRGIRGRCIYEIPTDEDESKWLSEHIRGAVKAGEEARVLKDVPMKMAVFDSRIVLFALADPVSKEPSLTSQIVEHRDVARSLKILFESLWEKAQDYHVLNALRR
jgi:sugar-specific transcriptional regulator TrmB